MTSLGIALLVGGYEVGQFTQAHTKAYAPRDQHLAWLTDHRETFTVDDKGTKFTVFIPAGWQLQAAGGTLFALGASLTAFGTTGLFGNRKTMSVPPLSNSSNATNAK